MRVSKRLPPACSLKVLARLAVAFPIALLLPLLVAGAGCVSRRGVDTVRARQIEPAWQARQFQFTPELAARVLALNAQQVSEADITNVLAQLPAPRIIKIQGGVQFVYAYMASLSEFLIRMGYPELSVVDPGDGRHAYNCYQSSERLAGMIAWYYAREGLRPMLVGHSQGGMQTVKILHDLAGTQSDGIELWNPLTWRSEGTTEFTDPLTGEQRPVVGLVLPYAAAVGAGGLTRVLPNQWDIATKLRVIPDSVEEFTGFCKGFDLLGGDFLGYGAANHYHAKGQAVVQNVWLPDNYSHFTLLDTRHLADDPAIRDWLNAYVPSTEPVSRPEFTAQFSGDTRHILFAAEVWYRIKKHWVLEVQRYVRAKSPPAP